MRLEGQVFRFTIKRREATRLRPGCGRMPLAGFGNAAVPFHFYSLSLIPKRLGAVITQVTGMMFVDLLGKTARIRIVRCGVPLAGAVCFAVSGVVHAIGTILRIKIVRVRDGVGAF